MKNLYLTLAAVMGLSTLATAQDFPVQINTENWNANDWVPTEVVVPASPLKTQVLFVGNVDDVQTLDANGNPNGSTPAKQWHDFIGFTPDSLGSDLGWVSVNHEMILADDKIGDGGGMTVFKVKRDPSSDTLIIVEQSLEDGREGMFFNVDFVNTVGETGMNCGGINSLDGRVWTAEEWFRTSTNSIYNGGAGVRDTADWTISTDIQGNFDGQTVRKFENFNWMVEIDPTQAKAIRKQYNWGRMGFEGGVVMPDNRTVFLGVDATPAAWFKFIADQAGDFTSGDLYAYTEEGSNHWIQIDNSDLNNMLNVSQLAFEGGATMYNRVEWVALSTNGKVYFTETGRDNPGSRWRGEHQDGGDYAKHHIDRALQQGTHPDSSDYADYYGRVMQFDPTTDEMEVFIAGGPEYLGTADVPLAEYPDKHLTNPDGLNFITIEGREFMIINEDLNGTSYGRMPAGISNRTCELYLVDMGINNPTIDDLIRIAVVPAGAEVTGACATPDGKTIMFNSQHPSSNNPFPYNNSLTIAVTGWDEAILSGALDPLSTDELDPTTAFTMFPNPATREVRFNKNLDVALYDISGQRLRVIRNSNYMDISELAAGTYFVRTEAGEVQTLIVQ